MTELQSSIGVQPKYFIVISEWTYQNIVDYKNKLLNKEETPGVYLEEQIKKFCGQNHITDISIESFICLLLATKKPKIYAAKELKCDGSDWTSKELKILGDINITMTVCVFDNGIWSIKDSKFKQHNPPFEAELLFTPGPLFKTSPIFVGQTPEFLEVVEGDEINQNKYNKLIERRLSPLFTFVNEKAKQENHSAIVTIPGLGCGVFAGKFKGALGEKLNDALKYIIGKNAKNYPHIACVYYDPHAECEVESKEFDGVKFRVRPYSNCGKPQLCPPQDYQEIGDDFRNYKLYKMVAWDHVSYPTNSYFVGLRTTDDGMVGGATSAMEEITGFKGEYKNGHYLPPEGMKTWKMVVDKNNTQLVANGNVRIVAEDGSYLSLQEHEESAGKN